MKIKINGTEHEPVGTNLTYENVVAIAGEREGASVMYSGPRHGDSRRSGTLAKGETVELEDGMNFDCVMTGNA